MNLQQTFQLALQHHQSGRLLEAEACYRQILAKTPRHPDALHMLGVIADQVGQGDVAVKLIRQAIAFRPKFPEAQSNLGIALFALRQWDEAIAAYRQAIALKPDYEEAHYNLGLALHANGQPDEAIAAYRQAIILRPHYPEALSSLGNALTDHGQLDEAIAAFHQCIALKPDYHAARHNLGIALLLQGRFAEGWEEYEWRWRLKEFASLANFAQPKWNGDPLEGRTILLHAEQGLGDAVQFIRYLPLVARRGGKIIIQCQTELQRLLQSMTPDLPVVARGKPLPAFDVHCPLLSLPRLFATDLTNIPWDVPYLQADASAAGVWRDRLADGPSSLKVGLVWAGSPTHRNDRNRSMKLASLAPLAQVPGVRFISLQKGEAGAEAKSPPQGMALLDAGQELKDFADTAALIAALDLVIAVDTSVVHLAGAMAKPVWVLLPFAPDWRWLLDRSDSPWYPTMHLFRQPRIAEWDPVIASVREQLQSLVQARD